MRARDKVSKNNVLCWGRRAGKTTFGADLVIETVLDNRGKFGWFAPNYKVLNPVWDYFVELLRPVTIERAEKDHMLKLLSKGVLECWSMDSGLVARSRDYDRVVIDEAAYTPNLKMRWEKEIKPTLVDTGGDAFFLSTPDGENEFKELYDLADTDPDWAHFHLPTWENPFLPQAERDRVRHMAEVLLDPVARQEYGAEFVSSAEGFANPSWVDACGLAGEWWKPLPLDTPICVGIDAGYKSDTFSISGQGKDPATGKYKTAFVKIFQPAELVDPATGIITFAKPKEFLRNVAKEFHVISFAYDPYQLVSTAGELYSEGIGFFEEFPQTTKRAMADQFLYELIRDRSWEYNMFDSDHKEMAQHIKNANAKVEAGEKRRMVKRTDKLKIDSGVATSIALFALTGYNV